MISYAIEDLSTLELYQLLSGAIAPRPIALVATKGREGYNLAPFSFFNLVSINPPMLVFSPLRKMRDASLKDTYHNLIELPECSVQVVTRDIVEKANHCAKEFPPQINEFDESGFTMLDSDMISVPRVAESPIQMECRVDQVITLGEKGGAGNLVLCRILKLHVRDGLLQEGQIDLETLQLVGRNNRDSYTQAYGENLFDLPKPI